MELNCMHVCMEGPCRSMIIHIGLGGRAVGGIAKNIALWTTTTISTTMTTKERERRKGGVGGAVRCGAMA